jgi:hypothetical protein
MKKGKKEEGEKLKEDLAKNGCVVTLKWYINYILAFINV